MHGSGENSYIWKDQIKDLILDYNLIAIDLPSHGKSESFSELSLELYVDTIKRLVSFLNIKNLILCGHSLGGAIAQSYYFKYPNDVNGLILCGTGARLRVTQFILENSRNNFNEFLDYLPLGEFFVKSSSKIKDDFVKQVEKMDPEVVYTDFKICDNFDLIDKVNLIDVPCLILCGIRDKLTPMKYSQYFHEKLKNSKLTIIKNAGHKVMLEKPDEVNKAIEDFIVNYLEK